MSQTQQPVENRGQRRAREKEEKKASKRLASFHSEAKPSSTQSVPTLNNKKKNRKSTAPVKAMSERPVSDFSNEKISATAAMKSPCELIMVESTTAPSVAVKANYDPVIRAIVTDVAEDHQAVDKEEEASLADQNQEVSSTTMSQAITQTPQEEESKENDGGSASVADPITNDSDSKQAHSSVEKTETVSEAEHSSVAAAAKTVVQDETTTNQQLTPASKQELNTPVASESTKSNVTLVGKEEVEAEKKQQQKPEMAQPQANGDVSPVSESKEAPEGKVLSTKGKSDANDKKSSNVLDLFKKEKLKKVGWLVILFATFGLTGKHVFIDLILLLGHQDRFCGKRVQQETMAILEEVRSKRS